MGYLREENVMRGKKIVTIYYVIVLALGITSLMLIRPEKPLEKSPEPICKFKIKYRGKKFESTDKVQFLSAKNYFKVATNNLDLFGFMVIDAKAKCTLKDFFTAVTEEAQKVGADYVHLTNVERYLVTQTYGWSIGIANIGNSETTINKRFTYYFALYRTKEVPEWQKDSEN
jgi:hypothetical protein